MKKYIILSMIVLQSLLSFSQDVGKAYKDYHKNGNVYREGYRKDNSWNGEWKVYYENGILSTKGTWNKGVKIGEWKTFNEDGTIEEKSNYLNGNLHGKSVRYFEDGTIKKKKNYLNGDLHGQYISYFEDGTIEEKSNYLNGELNGEYITYINYEGNRYKEEEGVYVNDLKNGLWKYYRKGLIDEEINYEDDKIINPITEYSYDDVKIYWMGPVNVDKGYPKIGDWKAYYANSKKIYFTGSYDNEGEKIGNHCYFYENGDTMYVKFDYKKYFYKGKEETCYSKYQSYYLGNKIKSYHTVINTGESKEMNYYENGNLESSGMKENGVYVRKKYYHNEKLKQVSKTEKGKYVTKYYSESGQLIKTTVE